MSLMVCGDTVIDVVDSVSTFINRYPLLKEVAEGMKGVSPYEVSAPGLLYVNQREYAVISPTDKHIKVVGTDDATTCHMVVIRHSGTGVVGLAHCDGCDTQHGLHSMIQQIITFSQGGPDGRLEVTLVGGFLDRKGESQNLSKEIFKILQTMDAELHLVCACITDYNNTLKNGVNFPHIYGIGVEVSSGKIFPARFPLRGPEMDVRSACHFGGFKNLMNIFDNSSGELVIGPYSWEPMEDVEQWLHLPDSVIRKYLSTSPEQEPPYFEKHVREAMKVLCDHPVPLNTLFPGSQPHRYTLQDDGSWTRVPEGS